MYIYECMLCCVGMLCAYIVLFMYGMICGVSVLYVVCAYAFKHYAMYVCMLCMRVMSYVMYVCMLCMYVCAVMYTCMCWKYHVYVGCV